MTRKRPCLLPNWMKKLILTFGQKSIFNPFKKSPPAAIHITGEMTFTFNLVHLLKEAGIPCIASTTERIVTEENGKKIVQFQFIQSREY